MGGKRIGHQRGWLGEIPAIAPPPGDVLGLKERNVNEWWSPADDPFRPTEVFGEVSQPTCSKGTGGGASGSNAQQESHHLYLDMFILEASSDYCERAVGIQGSLEDSQERLDDRRKVCTGSGRLVTSPTSPVKGTPQANYEDKQGKRKTTRWPSERRGGRMAKTDGFLGNDWNGQRQRVKDHEKMQVWVGEGDHFQRVACPPGKDEMSRAKPSATLQCNRRSDKRNPKPGR